MYDQLKRRYDSQRKKSLLFSKFCLKNLNLKINQFKKTKHFFNLIWFNLNNWLVDLFMVWMVDWLINWLVDWLINWLNRDNALQENWRKQTIIWFIIHTIRSFMHSKHFSLPFLLLFYIFFSFVIFFISFFCLF